MAMRAPRCDRFIWLIDDSASALRAHVLLGDALRLGGEWFEAEPAPLITERRTLMLRYASPSGVIGFCLPPLRDADPERLRRLRRESSLDAATQKWGRFLNLLGFAAASATAWREASVCWSSETVLVRRPHCANAVLDRLYVRDRDMAVERLEKALARHALAPVGAGARAV